MKRYFFSLIALLFIGAGTLNAQILKPVKWSFSTESLGHDEYNLVATATIEHGWFMYSQFIKEGGPIPTSFTFDKNENVTLEGKVAETATKIKELNEPLFDNMYLKKFGDKAIFTQKIKLKKNAKTKITGSLEFMTCDDKQCLAPETVPFTFTIGGDANDSKGETNPQEANPNDNKTTDAGTTPPAANGIEHPVFWTMELKKESTDIYVISFKAKIEPGNHIYSQFLKEGGPVATSFHFEPNANFSLVGKTDESSTNTKDELDPTWDMKIKSFADIATFTQKIKAVKAEGKLKGSFEYMCCNERRCLPPQTLPFEVDLKTGTCTITGQVVETEIAVKDSGAIVYGRFGAALSDCNEKAIPTNSSYWWIFILGFGSGLIGLLTPCVFPMIPLTVSFFLKSAKTRRQGIFNALWYSFFIVLIYFLLSLPFVLFQSISSDSYNAIATGPLLNTAFFAIFVVFAFSFFGYYDISLPSSLGNKVDSLSGLGSVLGIFFMALTLAIISFTCTGAFIGNLLAAAKDANGGPWTITFGFTGFGLAFALPFGLFALFPHMLNSLPKSGGWLHQVKVFLGFVELIFALKFISNADLVLQLGLLKREVFLGIWAVLGLLLTLYLFGFIRFKGDIKGEKIAGLRAAVGIVALAFTSYCIYGLPGNALNLFSGFPPPMSYSIFYTKPKLEPIKNNYAEALARAKKEGKPIMIDYTGWACVNCRKMEENVWPDKEILPLLDKYIVVSLYVDDRTKLPENQQYVSKVDGTKRLTVGNKWSDDEVETMHSNSQPFYALISPDEKLLAPPRGNTPKIDDYKAFLECGLSTFEGMKHATK